MIKKNLDLISNMLEEKDFGKNLRIVSSIEEVKKYMELAEKKIVVEVIATNNNQLDSDILGFAVLIPDKIKFYIPVLHRNYSEKLLLPGQIKIDTEVCAILSEKLNELEVITSNSKLLYALFKNSWNINCNISWDTCEAGNLLDNYGIKWYKDKGNTEAIGNRKFVEMIIEYINNETLFKSIENIIPKIDFKIEHTSKCYRMQMLSIGTMGEMKDIVFKFIDDEIAFIMAKANIEINGFDIDTRYLKKLRTYYEGKLEGIEEFIIKFYEDSKGYSNFIDSNFIYNIRLNDKNYLKRLIYDEFMIADISGEMEKPVDEKTIQILSNKYEVCKQINSYWIYSRILEDIDMIESKINPKTNRLQTELGSSNLVPFEINTLLKDICINHKDIDFNKLIVPSREGCFVEIDFSELVELIIGNSISYDKVENFDNFFDIYSHITSVIYNKTIDECGSDWKVMRRTIKALIFAKMNNLQLKQVSHILGKEEAEISNLYHLCELYCSDGAKIKSDIMYHILNYNENAKINIPRITLFRAGFKRKKISEENLERELLINFDLILKDSAKDLLKQFILYIDKIGLYDCKILGYNNMKLICQCDKNNSNKIIELLRQETVAFLLDKIDYPINIKVCSTEKIYQ